MIISIIEKLQRKKQRAVLEKHPQVTLGIGLKLGTNNAFRLEKTRYLEKTLNSTITIILTKELRML